MNRPLPSTFRVRIGPEVWRHDRGRTLVGGAPVRVVRLSAQASSLIVGDTVSVSDTATAALAERLLDAGIAHPVADNLDAVSLEHLTIVIPTFGRASRVRRLLAGLPSVSVIVVDDATPAPDAAELATIVAHAGARLIRLPENRGPGAARNAGLEAAKTDFVAFIDSDVVIPPGALESLLRHFADPRLALIGPRVVGLPGPGDNAISRYENARSSLDLWRKPALVRPRSSVAWMSSTCLIARRTAIPDGFDSTLRVGEDVDLVWRLARTEWRVRYDPEIKVFHEHRTSLMTWATRKAFYGTGGAGLAERHPRFIPPAILRPWSALALVGAAIGRPWSLLLAFGATGFALFSIHSRLPPAARSWPLSLRLTANGVLAALTQASALVLRHWWPITVIVLLFSRRARRITANLAVTDAVVEYVRLRPRLDPFRFAIIRRIDDLAYGAGLWAGAARRRSARALLPEVVPVVRRK